MIAPPQTEWVVAPLKRPETRAIAAALGISPLVAHVLCCRGITTVEDADRYFNPALEQLSDPMSLTGMDRAVARVAQARENRESVLVFGDYDVDGVAGTAIMAGALCDYGIEQVALDLPSRQGEGYGLGPQRVEQAAQDGVQLIITVDNGATAYEAAERARDLGIDLIVTDHHSLGDELPGVAAYLNPQQEPEHHPARRISGAAVAGKLATALTGDPLPYLDLMALGTVADVMPLQGENRCIVALGLDRIRSRPRLGLTELARVSKLNLERLTSEQIAFQLGPRINACGRLSDARVALDLILTEDADLAGQHAGVMDATNDQRRKLEAAIFDEAIAMLEENDQSGRASIVLAKPGWHAGVLGIVAARLMRKYHKPAVLIAVEDDGLGRGSARSVPGINIAEALAACGGHLIKHGGHSAAGGLTVDAARIEDFAAAMESEIARAVGDAPLRPQLAIDAQVSLSQLDAQLIHLLEHLQPFGQANAAPVFCTYGAEIVADSVRELRGGHIRLSVKEGPRVFPAVAFGMGERCVELAAAKSADIAYTPTVNTYGGETTTQLMVKDIQVLR